jgi:hypothetical protein
MSYKPKIKFSIIRYYFLQVRLLKNVDYILLAKSGTGNVYLEKCFSGNYK